MQSLPFLYKASQPHCCVGCIPAPEQDDEVLNGIAGLLGLFSEVHAVSSRAPQAAQH